MAPPQVSVQQDNSLPRNAGYRSFCISTVSPVTKVYGMEAGSKQLSNGCNATPLEEPIRFCVPTIQFDKSSGKKSKDRESPGIDPSDTGMANTTNADVLPVSSTTSTEKEPIKESKRGSNLI